MDIPLFDGRGIVVRQIEEESVRDARSHMTFGRTVKRTDRCSAVPIDQAALFVRVPRRLGLCRKISEDM